MSAPKVFISYSHDSPQHSERVISLTWALPWDKNPDGTARGPKDDLAAARRLIEQCGYWRRKEELEDAEEAAK
jgi:hypothetical protein